MICNQTPPTEIAQAAIWMILRTLLLELVLYSSTGEWFHLIIN